MVWRRATRAMSILAMTANYAVVPSSFSKGYAARCVGRTRTKISRRSFKVLRSIRAVSLPPK
jgi:hypothetical protein